VFWLNWGLLQSGHNHQEGSLNGKEAPILQSIMSVGGDSVGTISEEIRQGRNLRVFTYQDLKSATRNFRPDSLLGEGGFGSVYKGWIDEHGTTAAKAGTGLTVAVKQLNQEGLQGHKEWLVRPLLLFSSFPVVVSLSVLCTQSTTPLHIH
jgi:hypothetical protein